MDNARSRGSCVRRLMGRAVGVAVPALLAALLAAPADQASAAASGLSPRMPTRGRPVIRTPIPHAAAAAAAVTRARATGRPVVVAPDTTMTSQTAANPDGTFTYTVSPLPVRVRQRGRWVPVSARLVPGRGGLRPAAAVEPLTVSAGGAGPLAVLHGLDGQVLSLWFPGRLPSPIVSGATATYRSVRPGVDLRVTATALGGVTQSLVVRTAAAAASPWLRRFTERYATAGGLTLRSDAAGNLVATGRRGPVFTAAPPVASAPAPARRLARARASAPGLPATAGRAVVSGNHITDLVTGGLFTHPAALPLTVSITMAPASVTGARPSATSPAAVSPDVFPSPYQPPAPGYVEAQDVGGSGGCQGAKNWDGANGVTDLGIGFQAWNSCIGIYQTYYVFSTSGISSSWLILHMGLTLTEDQASWLACTDPTEPIYLHSLGASAGIGANTDGSDVSALGATTGSNVKRVPPASNPNAGDNCGPQATTFDVTGDGIQGHSSWTFGVSGDDTDNTSGGQFMRLTLNPTLSVTFDEYPAPPTMEQSSPPMVDTPQTDDPGFGCQTNSNVNPAIPWIGATSSVKLEADFTAPLADEQVEPGWAFWNFSSSNPTSTTYPNTSPGSFPYTFSNPVDGDEYGAFPYTTVNGNGGQDGYDPGESTGGQDCSFAVDKTPPQVPAVTSAAFPPSGSQAGTTQRAPGASGTFSFSSSDPPPAGCGSSNPIANGGFNGTVNNCFASGVYEFEYSLNSPLSYGGVTAVSTCTGSGVTSGAVLAVNPTGNPATSPSANPSAATTATSCPVSVNQWGTNILYVAAVDTAGNISQAYQYEFYVPWNSNTTIVQGSIVDNGGVPDVVTTDSSGNLVFFPAGTDPANGPEIASGAGDTPISGDNWNDFIVTHRGSWNQNTNATPDDLLALNVSSGTLYRYNNSGDPTGMFDNTGNVVTEFYPSSCSQIPANEGGAGTSNCAGYPSSWSDFTQIIAPGDAWTGAAKAPPATIVNDTTLPSMLGVASNGSLWLFQGVQGGQLANPVKLGSSGWDNATVMAAGDAGGQPTIWARINVGTDAGDIFSFPLTVPAGQVPTLNATTPGSLPAPAGGTMLVDASGSPIQVPAGSFPTLSANGPLSGDACGSSDTSGCPGFFAEDTSGDMFYYPGQPATTPAGALSGTSELIGDMNDIDQNSAISALNETASNALELDAVGADGALDHDVYSGTWSGWQVDGGSITGTPSAVYDAASKNQEVYATGTNNTLMEYYWQAGGSKRSWFNLGGAVQGSPFAIYNSAAGALQVYVTGIDGSLEQDYWTPAGGWTWNDLGKPSGVAACDSPVAMDDAITGNLDVFCVGTSGDSGGQPTGALEEIIRVPGGGWSAWKSLGSPGGVAVTGTPSPDYNQGSSSNEVYVTGSDGSLYEIWSGNSVTWSSWAHIGGTIAGSPYSVNDPISGDLDVFATAPGGTLEEDSWASGKGWTGFVNRGGAIAGSPSAVPDEVTDNTEIYSPGTAKIGREIAYLTNGTWTGWFNLGGDLAG